MNALAFLIRGGRVEHAGPGANPIDAHVEIKACDYLNLTACGATGMCVGARARATCLAAAGNCTPLSARMPAAELSAKRQAMMVTVYNPLAWSRCGRRRKSVQQGVMPPRIAPHLAPIPWTRRQEAVRVPINTSASCEWTVTGAPRCRALAGGACVCACSCTRARCRARGRASGCAAGACGCQHRVPAAADGGHRGSGQGGAGRRRLVRAGGLC